MTVYKLRPEAKEEIVQALLSGEYTQGFLALQGPLGFCCIGVATDVAAKHGVVQWEKEKGYSQHWGVRSEGVLDTTGLAPEVATWLGLPEGYEDIRFGDGPDDTLMTLNDVERQSFPEIAEVIKDKL